jgi:exodeoxyribonuclease VII large subunit
MHALDMARASAQGLRGQLRSLSPQQTLDRGYAIALTKNKNLVRSTADAPAGTELSLMLADGRLSATSAGAETDAGPPRNTK